MFSEFDRSNRRISEHIAAIPRVLVSMPAHGGLEGNGLIHNRTRGEGNNKLRRRNAPGMMGRKTDYQ